MSRRERAGGQRAEPWYRLAVLIIKPVVGLLFKRDFRGQDRIPRTGGVIVAINHISYADPFIAAVYVHNAGRRPRFLAKIAVFKIPLLGRIVRGAHQIPVYRETADAGQALIAAVQAVQDGECVVVYPEGTVTKDPAYWPMHSKTGVARIALATGAPVIPVGQWGALYFRGRDQTPHPFPRKKGSARAGAPVDLSRWAGAELTTETLRDATDAVLDAVAAQVSMIRDEPVPSVRFKPGGRADDGDAGARRSA